MNKKSFIIFGVFVSLILLVSCVSAKQVYLRPTSNFYSNQWSSACSSHYQCVDEVTPTTDSVYTKVNGIIEGFNVQDMSSSEEVGKVNFVQIRIYAKHYEPFIFWYCDHIKPLLLWQDMPWDSVSIETGEEIDLGFNYQNYYSKKYYVNPFTNQAWTREDVNKLNVGVKSTDGGIVSKIDLIVDYIVSDCGNNIKEEGEFCDGTDKLSCQDLGHPFGYTACAIDCKSLDSSGCDSCGDGILQPEFGEVCDIHQHPHNFVGGVTCESLGYFGGELECSYDCKEYYEAGFCISELCISDSDEAQDYTLKGEIELYDINGASRFISDSCESGKILRQYYCAQENNLSVYGHLPLYDCVAAGYDGCVDGACVNF